MRNLLRVLIPSAVLLCAGLQVVPLAVAQDKGGDPPANPLPAPVPVRPGLAVPNAGPGGPAAPGPDPSKLPPEQIPAGGLPPPPPTAPSDTVPAGPPVDPEPNAPEAGAEGGQASGLDAQGMPRTTEVNKPPCLDSSAKVRIDFVDIQVRDLTEYMARITCKNFILTDDLKGQVTIISHTDVSVAGAYEAYLAALDQVGYTTVDVGSATKIVANGDAASSPLRVYQGDSVSASSAYITQIFELQNVSVSDVSSVAQGLLGNKAKVVAYAPTNTLIVTDSAVNIRRMWKVVGQLDVAAPRSSLQIVQLSYADAADVKTIIEEVYGTAESSSSSSSRSSAAPADSAAARRRRRTEPEPAPTASSTNVGSEGSYISKIVDDERTNSLIILANDEAMAAVMELIAQLDVDVDPSNRSQIHVIYLEHAKAEDVASVLSNLSQSSSANRSSQTSRTNTQNRTNQANAQARGRTPEGPDAGPGGELGGATALLDDNVRVTSDENTNSLVIVAPPEAFEVLEDVIQKLDIRRKQVFVEVVIMELASEDEFDVGLGVHLGKPGDLGGLVVGSAQLNGSSLGLSQDMLSGLAMGVFGESIDVTSSDGMGGTTTLSIPAFGVAINAMQANSQVNILSTPNVLTLDNEEAEIVVGRNIPFPVSAGRDSNNNPLITYQREDVAITLKVTPQINESDYVTLEVFQEVTEIEEDAQGLDVTTAGFITSKRSAETTVLVKDNQTIVIGGLMGQTSTEVETKVPILGDLPLIGALFRGKRESSRKTNLLIFLTPHVIDEPADLEEVYRVKVAQREEFLRRFYGKSEVEQLEALNSLLSYSMNIVDEPSRYRSSFVVEEAPLGAEPSREGGVGATPTEPVLEDPASLDPSAVDPSGPDGAEDGDLEDTGLEEAP